jgi:hypothetical protein
MPRRLPHTSPERPLDAEALRLSAELLSLPAQHLRELPVLTRIVVHHPGMNRDLVLWSGAAPSPREGLVFDGDELHAIARGVEAERLWAWDFTAFCLLKQHDPKLVVTEALALSGAQWVAGGPAWPLGKVLERLGLLLISVELLEHPPAQAVVLAGRGSRAA